MNINVSVGKGNRIQAFYLFFIIVGIQIGIGILGAPRYIIQEARQDAWLSIVIAYIGLLIVIAAMFMILSRYENADILGIHQHLFGSVVAKLLGCIYIFYFTLELLSVLSSYVEIVKVFLFPTIPIIVLASMILLIVGYSVLGGIRVITGVVFLFSLLSFWIVPLIYDPMSRMDATHFLPMFDASFTELMKGAKSTSYTFFGPEILLFIYPFIENKNKMKMPVFLSVTFTCFTLLIATIVSIGYFSLEGIENLTWPVISLYKSVSFSFMERFDYFIIVEWMMIIVTTIILLMWIIVHSIERLFQIEQKKSVVGMSIILLLAAAMVSTEIHSQKLTDFNAKIGFWIVYIYPLILLPIVLFKTKRNYAKDVRNDENQ